MAKANAPKRRKELKKVDKGQVHIQSSFNNIKVTFPEDFEVVAKYIETTKEETKTDYMISKDAYSENVANN